MLERGVLGAEGLSFYDRSGTPTSPRSWLREFQAGYVIKLSPVGESTHVLTCWRGFCLPTILDYAPYETATIGPGGGVIECMRTDSLSTALSWHKRFVDQSWLIYHGRQPSRYQGGTRRGQSAPGRR